MGETACSKGANQEGDSHRVIRCAFSQAILARRGRPPERWIAQNHPRMIP